MPSPIIHNGPNPPGGEDNPSGDLLAIGIGGQIQQWKPPQLTNFGIDAYGTGTIELIGPSSLVNASLNITGQNSNLVNDGTMLRCDAM
jgi:hypothetical protein